ncbi:putative serine/threonine-protein kinase VPS15 [Spathaspora sp. JA1]|nr:putative serine/threonine-protein kinase VPS15 [Spathaspora sp. JA1]
MGQRLSLLAPSAPTVAISSYIDDALNNNYQYFELLSNSRFLKTIKAIDKSTGELVIIKLLIKPSTSSFNIQLQGLTEFLVKQSITISPMVNVCCYSKIIETDRAGYLIRQMIKTNLYDRLSIRPFLEPIEKSFITFQLLKLVNQLHSLNIHHGDLRLENCLITSWNWILLSDFSNMIKPTYIPMDNPNQYSFYFDGSSNRRICYLAPERFYKGNLHKHANDDDVDEGLVKETLTDAMDLFGLGCIIAELYSDGQPTFTLSQLFKYIQGEGIVDLSYINEVNIVKLVLKLLKLNPNERSTARELLDEFYNVCFPEYFYTFLYEFMEGLNTRKGSSDDKIEYIYDNFESISKALHFEYSENNNEEEHFPSPIPMKLNLPTMPYNYSIQVKTPQQQSEPALIILNVICSFCKTSIHVDSKLKAIELILTFSEQISDECKLNRSLPYLFSFIDEYVEYYQQQQSPEESHISSKVVCNTIHAITTLLLTISYITPINTLLFPEYLLPKLYNLLVLKLDPISKKMISCSIATCLPYLSIISQKFWIMSKTFANPPEQQLSFEKFKTITLILLTDSESSVKCNMLVNILPLCQFFGADKTNDIILPHLISYLNDHTNHELRLIFLQCVVEISPFIGIISFEQYLLPLLVQTLKDNQEMVILKVIQVFHIFIKNKFIINKWVYNEILINSIGLIIHPNQWIRHSIINLIIAINDNLTNVADSYCWLYPILQPYLTYDITVIDWNSLYTSLTRPITIKIFEMSRDWSRSKRSLFWKTVVKPIEKNPTLSHEDKQWVIKLKSIGLEEKELWKINKLQEYIRHSHAQPPEIDYKFNNPQLITPRNIFFDITYKSEPMIKSRTRQQQIDIEPAKHSGSFLSPKVTASIQTMETNVFGELDGIVSHSRRRSSSANGNIPSRVFSINNSKIITTNIRHTYSGNNPYIINYLNGINLTPSLSDFPEFGSVNRKKSSKDQFKPKGNLVGHLKDDEIDAITCIEAVDTFEFFIIGYESGIIKLWDSFKMEKVINSKNYQLSMELASEVTCICVIPDRFVFVACTKDGQIRVYSVEVNRNKNRKIVRFVKFKLLRQIDIEGYVVQAKISNNFLILVDSNSKILMYDVITMEKVKQLQNPLVHGIITSFIVDTKTRTWIVIGTNQGVVSLWDLRFNLLVKSYQLKYEINETISNVKSIKSFELVKQGEELTIAVNIGGETSHTIVLLDIPSFECKTILRVDQGESSLVERYFMEAIPKEIQMNEDLFKDLTITRNKKPTKQNEIMCIRANLNYLICATYDKRIILWNLTDTSESCSISSQFQSRFVQRNVKGTTIIDEKLQTLNHSGDLEEEIQSSVWNDGTTKPHLDVIKCLNYLYEPFEMILSGDRSGVLNLYK